MAGGSLSRTPEYPARAASPTSRTPGSPLSLQRCWDVALAPLKQIPMNLFIMYMAGNTISIFPAMMVCMMGWRPLQALMSLSASEYNPVLQPHVGGHSLGLLPPHGHPLTHDSCPMSLRWSPALHLPLQHSCPHIPQQPSLSQPTPRVSPSVSCPHASPNSCPYDSYPHISLTIYVQTVASMSVIPLHLSTITPMSLAPMHPLQLSL